MIDRRKFAQGLLALADLWDKTLSETQFGLYLSALDELDDEGFERAVALALKRCKFFPKPSELLELAVEQSAGDRGIVAFTELKGAIAAHGAYASVDFEDAVINAVVRGMGGWVRMCAMPAEEFELWARKEFERQYAAFLRGLPAEYDAALGGIIEQHNIGKGLAPPPALRIASTSPLRAPTRIAAPLTLLALAEGTGGG